MAQPKQKPGQPPPKRKPLSFQQIGRLAKARAKEFTLISKFLLGYRNREDITNLTPGVLVQGSQNVLTNVSDRFGTRQGYTLDGPKNVTINGIVSAYDFATRLGVMQHLRGWGTSLEYRYKDSSNVVTYRTLLSGLANANFQFCDFWDFNSELKNLALMVNGTDFIWEWSGGVGTIASSTTNTITINGTKTWAQNSFYSVNSNYTATTISFTAAHTISDSANGFITAGYKQGMQIVVSGSSFNNSTFNITAVTAGSLTVAETVLNEVAGASMTFNQLRQIVINGNTYSYTGGAATTTITGVSPSPIAEAANSIVHQTPVQYPNSAIMGLPVDFKQNLIGYLGTQVYFGSTQDNTVYISQQNNFHDLTFSSPVRIVGEGALVTLDGTMVGFYAQDDGMYMTAGLDYWYRTKFTLSSDLTKEQLSTIRIKTASLQGAQSQSLISKIKNSIIYVSNEPSLDELGLVANINSAPQIVQISDSVKLDFDSYDFTDGSLFYYRYFIYVSIPKEGLVRVYNLEKKYWEAPLTLPIGKFSVIDGELYGHDYNVPQTYKLFDGYNDNGFAIDARAVFSYENLGVRALYKDMTEFYVEGYMTSNVALNLNIIYEKDGLASETSYQFLGSDSAIVAISPVDNSLGKNSLGKISLGGTDEVAMPNDTPPKFRVIQTFANLDHFEKQVSFTSYGKDFHWEIVSFGDNSQISSALQNSIKK